jgi:Type II secretion system (T2SS), protein E, N-terminal domain
VSTPLRERPDAPLGTLIFRAGLLPAETIESALEEGVKTGKRLGEILTERGLISEVDLARLLAGQKGLEFVTLREQIVDPSAATLFSEEQARLFRALPYSFDGELPVVAIADPTDEVLMRNIREALGREDARFVVTARGELAEIAADVYAKAQTAASSPEPAAEPTPEPPVEPEPEPDLAAHTEHVNGTGPDDAELTLQVPAPERVVEAAPEPEPAPVVPEQPEAPEQPAPQAHSVDEAVVEEPVAAEPVAAEPIAAAPAEPESTHEPAPAPVLPAEPAPAPAPHTDAEPPVSAPAQAPEPTAAVEPVVEPEPVVAPEPPLRVEPVQAPAPPPAVPVSAPVDSAETIPFPQPEPAPPAPPYPPAAEAPAPPFQVPAEPAPADPAAVEAPEPVAADTPGGPAWRLTIRLTNGERVEAGDYADQEAAKQEAKAVMAQVADADSGEWPFVNGRFLKPDTIVSVDIAELSGEDF